MTLDIILIVVTYEMVKFEKWLVQIQDFKKFAHHLRGICESDLTLNHEERLKDFYMQLVGLGNTRILTDYPQNPTGGSLHSQVEHQVRDKFATPIL